MRYILGIETSCDETAAAIWDVHTQKMLSSEVFSQIKLHAGFGGVMPEVASRSHVEKIGPIVDMALANAGVSLSQVNVVAVTNYPGLLGSLLVGVSYAKSLAYGVGAKLLGVSHNHGHIVSSFLHADGRLRDDLVFPHLALSVSGGHSSIFLVTSPTEYEEVGRTTDDAAGEAFDKVARLLGLPYPGGPYIEKLAASLNFQDFFHYPRNRDKKSINFSFSGLKTQVLYHLVQANALDSQTNTPLPAMTSEFVAQVASSFQVCMRDIFVEKLTAAIALYPDVKAISLVGGVACNKFISAACQKFCDENNKLYFSSPGRFCTDNAGMIALAAHFKILAGHGFADWHLDVERNWRKR